MTGGWKFPGPPGQRGVWRLGIRRKATDPRGPYRWMGKSHSGTVVEVEPVGRQRTPRKVVRTDCGLTLGPVSWLVRISPARPMCKRCQGTKRWRGR